MGANLPSPHADSEAVTDHPIQAQLDQLPSELEALRGEVEAYPLAELIAPYFASMNASASRAELERIHHWIDFCLCCWMRGIDELIAEHPQGSLLCVQRAKARLLADHNTLQEARTRLAHLHVRGRVDPASGIGLVTPALARPVLRSAAHEQRQQA